MMGHGDGWLRSFDAETGKELWKFDINRKAQRRGEGTRIRSSWNDLMAMPVLPQERIYFTTGRHYEVGGGSGRLCCVDPTRSGDVSSELVIPEGEIIRNPDSELVWEYDSELARTLSS